MPTKRTPPVKQQNVAPPGHTPQVQNTAASEDVPDIYSDLDETIHPEHIDKGNSQSPQFSNWSDSQMQQLLHLLQRELTKRNALQYTKGGRGTHIRALADEFDDVCSPEKSKSQKRPLDSPQEQLVTADVHVSAPLSGQRPSSISDKTVIKKPRFGPVSNGTKADSDRAEQLKRQANFQNEIGRIERVQSQGTPVPTASVKVSSSEPSQELNSNEPLSSKIPPIILRDKSRWSDASAFFARQNYRFSKAQNMSEGIRIFPASVTDFRSISKYFQENGYPYHTFELPEEKVLRVVFRGIPCETPCEDVLEDLKAAGFHPQAVVWMKKPFSGRQMPLVLVKLARQEQHIYNVTTST